LLKLVVFWGDVGCRYKASSDNIQAFAKRRLPVALCRLLSKLLDVDPFERPGSDQVLKVVRSRQVKIILIGQRSSFR
jgi:hypothetical protein